MDSVRVRFAPSPTGDLHIGGVRTALFNYLYSKNKNGAFILRVEDTDEARSTNESVDVVLSAMKWLKLTWDEGPGTEVIEHAPYYQMKRKENGIYLKYVNELLYKGLAYYCYCTPEEVDSMRKEAQDNKLPPKYNGRCRHLTLEQRKQKELERKAPVIRFKCPREGITRFDDLIRGRVKFDNFLLDDFVIMKANEIPTYNFACVIDDYLMKITHVLRGDDHISNTPKQIQIYAALEWETPFFAHLSMILGQDGVRLSKRHGHTSVLSYRKEGYLPEALINYLALLGWATSDSQQLFEVEELIRKFSLKGCGVSPSAFDPAKLLWLNGEKIRSKTPIEVYELFLDWIRYTNNENLIYGWDDTILRQAISLEHDKIKLLKDIPNLIDFFFTENIDYQEDAIAKVFFNEKLKLSAEVVLRESAKGLLFEANFSADSLEKYARDLAKEQGIKAGQVFHPIRVAISGRTQGPSLFHMMELMGKEKVVSRIKAALSIFFKN